MFVQQAKQNIGAMFDSIDFHEMIFQRSAMFVWWDTCHK